tara:strand:- start:1524 stop:1763 length:240 start_codon:yes stop_codon:yes gene_type:complete
MATQTALKQKDENIEAATATYRNYVEGQLQPINAVWQKLSSEDRLAIVKKSDGLKAMINFFRDFENWLGVDRDASTEEL